MVEVKKMTAMYPAWAHTYQSMCLGFSPDQLRPTTFPLPKPTNRFSILLACRTTTRMTGIESPGYRLFTDGGFKRQPDGSEMAGWRIAAVSLDNFVRILCGPLTCDPCHLVFLGATSCSNDTAELTGFAEALRWTDYFTSRGERVRILSNLKTRGSCRSGCRACVKEHGPGQQM